MISKTQDEIMLGWKASAFPVVSVLCIAYNHEKYIGACLDHVLMQETNFPFEIIVHDDASTDSTPDIIKKYQKKYPEIIHPILQKENLYSKHDGSIFEETYVKCAGEYIATCECDDYWIKKNKLQMQYDFLSKHKEYVACGHLTKVLDCSQHNKAQHQKAVFLDSRSGDYTLEDASHWQLFAHYSSYFMKNIFRHLSQKEKEEYLAVRCSGDRKLPLLLQRYGKLYVMDEYASVYRYMSSPDSFTANRRNLLSSKVYMECIDCEAYALQNGWEIDFKERKEEVLVVAFLSMLILRDVKSFGQILKLRKSIWKDLGLCLKKTPNYLRKRRQSGER